MAERLQVLYVEFGAKNDRFKRGVREVNQGMNSVKTNAGALSRTLSGIGWAAAGTAALQFGKHLVTSAARAEEVGSKFNAVFKETAADADRWAKDTGEALGRSQTDLKEYLATIQDTFVPLGFARDQAAEMSKQVTQLAIDLASFNNTSDPEALKALQSALVGNHETMRQYGVIINQAVLDQELLRLGFNKSAKGATEQQKAQARLNLIIAGTSDAQGDAARTGDTYTGQVRKLQAAADDLSVAIGEALLPAMTKLVEILNTLARAFPAQRTIVEWQLYAAVVENAMGVSTIAILKALDVIPGLGDFSEAIEGTKAYVAEVEKEFKRLGLLYAEILTEGSDFVSARGTTPIPAEDPFAPPGTTTGGGKRKTRIDVELEEEVLFELAKMTDEITGHQLRYKDAVQLSTGETNAWARALTETGLRQAELTEEQKKQNEQLTLAGEAQRYIGATWTAYQDQIISSMATIVADFENWRDIMESIGNLAKQLIKDFAALAIRAAALAAINLFSGGSFNIGSQFLGLLGARADGGPVRAGGGYVVGERGPELFVPNRSGTIVPNAGAPTVILQGNLSVRMDELVFALENHERRFSANA